MNNEVCRITIINVINEACRVTVVIIDESFGITVIFFKIGYVELLQLLNTRLVKLLLLF